MNLGSGGVAFTTTRRLPINAPVEISINWPARLNGTCALKLVVTGRVIRSEEGNAVVQIERHVFRTCAAPDARHFTASDSDRRRVGARRGGFATRNGRAINSLAESIVRVRQLWNRLRYLECLE